jgi:hypothetical protein
MIIDGYRLEGPAYLLDDYELDALTQKIVQGKISEFPERLPEARQIGRLIDFLLDFGLVVSTEDLLAGKYQFD